ncbi:MAG: acyl carrier protein, partial [Acidimicrobiales bacterium]
DLYVFAYYRSSWVENQRRRSERRADAGRGTLSFEEFRNYLENEFEPGEGSLSGDTAFVDNLSFDSVKMLELLCAIEDLGVTLDEKALVDVRTVDDAFFGYIQGT